MNLCVSFSLLYLLYLDWNVCINSSITFFWTWMEHCRKWTVLLNMASLAYSLLLETWQRFLSHSRARFGLREEAVATLSMSWRWSSVSLDLYLDLLKFKVEKSFWHKYVLPKRHMVRLNIRESRGKLGLKSLKNCPSLSAFPLTSLNFALSSELHCSSMSSIWSTEGASCTSKEKGSAKMWKVALCVLKSANLWSNSSCSLKMTSTYSSALNGVPASTSALHAGKWQRFVWESWAFQSASFVENALTLS